MQGSERADRELLDTLAVCGDLVPVGSVHRFLAEHRLELFPDGLFAGLFSGRGRRSQPASVIATVLVLVALEGLSDREAVGCLRFDVRWKAAAGLGLTDGGFHHTMRLGRRRGAQCGPLRRPLRHLPPTRSLHHQQQRAHHQRRRLREPPPSEQGPLGRRRFGGGGVGHRRDTGGDPQRTQSRRGRAFPATATTNHPAGLPHAPPHRPQPPNNTPPTPNTPPKDPNKNQTTPKTILMNNQG